MDAEGDPLDLESWPPELDRDAVGPALQAFAEAVGDDVECELVITSDFEGQVRDRMEPEIAAAYFQDRGDYGTAMAKTLRAADGRVSVVFDVRLFARGAAHPVPATFRHEALHVLLGREGESTFDSRGSLAERCELSPELVAMAGVAVEEYRVQLATYYRFPDNPWGGLPGALRRLPRRDPGGGGRLLLESREGRSAVQDRGAHRARGDEHAGRVRRRTAAARRTVHSCPPGPRAR